MRYGVEVQCEKILSHMYGAVANLLVKSVGDWVWYEERRRSYCPTSVHCNLKTKSVQRYVYRDISFGQARYSPFKTESQC